MKKILYALVLIVMVISALFFYRGSNDNLTTTGAETVNYQEGHELAKNEHYYRKFDHKTADNLYVVQDFYTGFNVKLTDPFILTNIDQLKYIPSTEVIDSSYYQGLTIYGMLRIWSKEQQPIEELYFSDGKVSGLVMKWFTNGKKFYERSYTSGIANGVWRQWYDSGQIKVEGNYIAASRDGLWREWYADGSLALEDNYVKDILNGYHVYYDENKIKREEGNYSENKRIGTWYLADATNIYSSMGDYEDGLETGLWTYFYKGMKMSEGRYLAGKQEGLWTYWRSLRQKEREVVYKDGVKISEKLFPDRSSTN